MHDEQMDPTEGNKNALDTKSIVGLVKIPDNCK
jgi:hypothetical protein